MEIGFGRSIGRKRVVVSEIGSPLKRVNSGRFNFNSQVSPLETLPQDILVN